MKDVHLHTFKTNFHIFPKIMTEKISSPARKIPLHHSFQEETHIFEATNHLQALL